MRHRRSRFARRRQARDRLASRAAARAEASLEFPCLFDHWNAQESFTMLETLRNRSPAHAPDWDWNELRRSAFATSLRVLQSPHDAEDAAQEALLRAWRARGRCK